jgi:hypothetical protein
MAMLTTYDAASSMAPGRKCGYLRTGREAVGDKNVIGCKCEQDLHHV